MKLSIVALLFLIILLIFVQDSNQKRRPGGKRGSSKKGSVDKKSTNGGVFSDIEENNASKRNEISKSSTFAPSLLKNLRNLPKDVEWLPDIK
ncbi:hypothetical protein PVAND_015832 [Polypedilum vanderplanki]|uniref:Uncharacterized protein n=1 Tax=Polypedilum vanderplanki TaxID=319348 RepID=A0A9J6BE14_POLVA|nr:hypothetical protein PVAND_015832 [Polypedilum vanderplanki]